VKKEHEDNITVKDEMSVSSFGPVPAGQPVVALMYPRGANEPAPKVEPGEPGVVRVTTGESVDYLFADRKPINAKMGDVSFEGLAGAVRVFPDAVHFVIAEGGGIARYKDVTFVSPHPATIVVPLAELTAGRRIEVPPLASHLSFALDPAAGKIEDVAPGVQRQTTGDRTAVAFHSGQPIHFDQDGIVFHGRSGGVVRDKADGSTRLVLLDGDQIAAGDVRLQHYASPVDVTVTPDTITGRSEADGGILILPSPKGITYLPEFVLDGRSWGAGTNGPDLIIPLPPGEHEFQVRNLKQPEVFRDWQRW
jgi:hypothetical protein